MFFVKSQNYLAGLKQILFKNSGDIIIMGAESLT